MGLSEDICLIFVADQRVAQAKQDASGAQSFAQVTLIIIY